MDAVCRHCGKQIEMRNVSLPGARPIIVPIPCGCTGAVAERAAEKAEEERQARASAFADAWTRSGVPSHFAHVTAEFDLARPVLEGRSMYLYGKNGRGKTHAACQIAKAFLIKNTYSDGHVMRCWKSMQFLTVQQMFSSLRSSWGKMAASEKDMFARWAGVDLLVLDDLGKGVPSEWAAENIFDLIDRRWSNDRPMVITSQYTTTEIADRYEKAGAETMLAMLSRISGWCDGVTFDGEDKRLS